MSATPARQASAPGAPDGVSRDPLSLSDADVPRLPRGVRIAPDRVRGGHVLLAPEKAVRLDAVGHAILSRIDGRTRFDELVSGLARDYAAPEDQIRADVQKFLIGLRARIYLELAA